jgi:hypothetical protein
MQRGISLLRGGETAGSACERGWGGAEEEGIEEQGEEEGDDVEGCRIEIGSSEEDVEDVRGGDGEVLVGKDEDGEVEGVANGSP